MSEGEVEYGQAPMGDTGEEYGEEYGEEAYGEEEEEELPEIILPTTSDIEAHIHTHPRPGVANYLQSSIQLGGVSSRSMAPIAKPRKTSVLELDIDTLEDKPWRRPGVDISQYFNYGFNEDTWRAYCSRQHQMKMESQNLGKIAVYESREEEPIRPVKPEYGHGSDYRSAVPAYHPPDEDSGVIQLVGGGDHEDKYHSSRLKAPYGDDYDRRSGGARRRDPYPRDDPYGRPRERERDRDYDGYGDRDRERYDRHRDHRDYRDSRDSRGDPRDRDPRDRDERRRDKR